MAKIDLLKALDKTARAYYLPQATEKSLEWEVCKVFKGDCEACIWSVYGKPDIKTGKFPCQQRPLPPLDPSLALVTEAMLRFKLFTELKEFFKEIHYYHVTHKTDYFKTMFKKTIRNVYRRKRKKATSAFSK